MSFHKYLSAISAECFLKSDTVRFSQPSTYNDPFEFSPTFRCKNELQNTINLKVRINSDGNEVTNFIIDPTKISQYPFSPKIDFASDISKNIVTTCFSFSESELPNNILMWSHYAESYRGIAIKIKENTDITSCIKPIKYVETRPVIDAEYLTSSPEVNLSDLYFKSTYWRYESEYRLAVELDFCTPKGVDGYDNTIYVAEIEPSKVDFIIVGVNANESIKVLAREYALRTGVDVFYTSISESGFDLKPAGGIVKSYDQGMQTIQMFRKHNK